MGLCIGLSLGKRDPLRLRHLPLQGGGKGIPFAYCGAGRLVWKGSSSLLPGDRWPTPLLPFSPLAGEMPKAEGGSAVREPYLLIIRRPPPLYLRCRPGSR